MFTIDFTKPWLYKDIIYFNQGNLSTNNTLRCKLVTGGSDDFTGGSIACTFTTKDSVEISGFGRLIDAKSGIIDIVFPGNALVVGTNKLEVLVNRADGGVAQSPSVMYDIWQGLTTGNGVQSETNYPILIELINSTNEASNKANSALNKANSMITDITDAIDNAYRSANEAEIATSNANTKIEEIETSKLEMIKKVDVSIVTMKSEVETAKNEMVSKADEKIADVDRALAAGTVDLELKQAREDASGVVYDNLKQMLDANLGVEGKTLKDLVIDMNDMKEMQDLEYSTDKGYAVCEKTGNGTVKDLKIYGKSLINRKGKKVNYFPSGSGNNVVIASDSNVTCYEYEVEPNSVYTIEKFTETDRGNVSIFSSNVIGSVASKTYYNVLTNGSIAITTGATDKYVLVYVASTSLQTDVKINFIKEEHTQSSIGYFEGLSSVGNGNEIEVLSRKEDGNLLNTDSINVSVVNGISGASSRYKCEGVDFSRDLYVNAYDNNGYNVISPNLAIRFSDKDMKQLFWGSLSTKDRILNKDLITKPESVKYVEMFWNSSMPACNISKLTLSYFRGECENKQDKKTILFKDTDNTWKPVTELRGINLNSCDVIDSNKNTLTRNCDGKLFNGSENWIKANADKANTSLYQVKIENIAITKILCDKYKQVEPDIQWNNDEECISLNGDGYIGIRSKKKTIEEFKIDLSVNNIEIVFKLKQGEQFEVNPLELESFDNITLWLILSGVIAPPASFKITSSLPNFVKNVDTRVKRMENDFYKYTVTQNRMQLGTTYSSDRTTFRVDTATFSSVKAKQDLDYDLFRLLKHNILVGPQNYDKAEMENMMDFYVSVGKIDYNMWDELYMLIEAQHNPPVEEEAPVI